MKRKLLFITLLMLFCSTMFGQHWTMTEAEQTFYQGKMSYYTYATIDGDPIESDNIEIAAFHGNELRGCATPIYNTNVNKYLFVIDIYGTSPGDKIYFKLFKPGVGEFGADVTVDYDVYYVPSEIPTIDFYNMHWNYTYSGENYMQYPCVIKIDGVLQERTNLELAAFCGEELRGVTRPQKENITEGLDIYMASLKIEGTNNETISFKLYDPTINRELSTDKTILFDLEYGNQNVVEIDFRNEAVAQITNTTGTHYFASLAAAVNAAGQNETTIVMIADAEVSETVKVVAGQKITLDLNGKTIDGTEKVRIALMSYGDLTIKDSTEEKNGMIKAGIGTGGNTVNICKGTFTLESGNIYSKNNAILIDEETAIVNINGGTITAEPTTNNSAAFYISSTSDTEVNIKAGTMKGFNGILLWNNTKINITGGSVIAEGDLAIQGNGSRDNTEINISGENTIITGKDAAIYHPQGGKLNISGGTITGSTGIVVKGGEVTISGGTINGTGEAVAYAPVSSGYQGTGDALYVEHYDNSQNSENYGTPTVTVTGGTFNSTNAQAVASYANPNNDVEAIAKFISGGTFDNPIAEAYCAEGYIPADLGNGKYGVKQGTFVARVNGVGYETVTAAIAAAQAGETVQLLPGEISEYIAPWANDTQHTSEKSITILGSENFGTTLTGGLYLGYDDSQCRDHSIIVKGVAFKTKGILVACQKNVTIEGNKFENITDNVANPGSASKNAISVIGLDVNATIKNNVINTTASVGIDLRNIKAAVVEGNTVSGTQHNSMQIQNASAESEATIVNNTFSNWGQGGEGRAMRINGIKEADVNGNVMSCATAPEEFVKVTGSTTLDASANYWNGNSPLSGNYFLSDLAADPVSILKSYYTDAEKSNLVQLSASVAKIGTTYYQTINAAIAAAQAGETVEIFAGTFTQNLDINKAITVVGERDAEGNNLVSFNGKLNMTVDGAKAKNLNVNNGSSTAGYISAKNVLVEGCNVTGGNGFRYCYTAGTVTFKDSKITGATYGIHFDGSEGGNIVIDNCDIIGWTSFAGTITNVAITDTDFLNGNYNQLRFYQNSQMTNCKFNEEMTIDFGMNDVNAEFEGCAVVDTEGNATGAPLTDVIYLGDIAEMGVDVTINSEPVIVEAKVADNNGDNASYFLVFQEALNAAQANQTVTVLQDITLDQTATIAVSKEVVLDLNGKTINAGWENESDGKHIYAFTNNGTLTIKDSSTEANGTINARGNHNYGTMTLVNGTINAIDGNGGYGVRNYSGASFTMNAGTIATTLEDDNKVDKGGYDATPVRVDEGATFTMNGGTINNICDFTVAIDNYGTTTIEGGTFTSVHTTVINHGTMTIDGGTFTCTGLEGITAHALWAAAGTTTINGGTFNGKDNYNGFNVDASEGATVYITGGNFLPVHSGSLYGKGTIVVSGGTFFDDVTEFCAEGFIAKVNTEGTYDVRFADYIFLPTGMNESNYETLFGTNTVTDGINYYATLQKAVEAVVGKPDAILYCKPGADVGSLQHAPVTNTLTVYGNGAFVSGGAERDFDLGNTDPSFGQDITSDMTLTVKYLDGCGVWGAKATEHTVNLVFENCYNMGKAFITGTTGTLNITMKDCAFEGVIAEALYSNADGTIALTDVAFSNLDKAINLNHKAAGTQTVTMTGCTFTNCGNVVAADQIPVRVLSSVEGGSSVLTVNACTFTGTPEGGADILLDYGIGLTTATVSNTAAYVVVEREANKEPEETTTLADQTYTFDNRPYVAKVGDVSYKTIAEALAAVQDGGTITLINNATEEFAIEDGKTVTLDMATYTLTGAITPSKANLTIKNGTINNENASYSAIEINEGSLVLNDVRVTSKRHGVRIDGYVTATINGGEYRLSATSGTRHAVNVSGDADVTITDGIFVGPKGTTMDSGSAVCVQLGAEVTIEGGDFSGGKNATLGVSGTMIVKGGIFDQDPSEYVAEGYLCGFNQETERYEVTMGVVSVTQNGSTTYYRTLAEAITAVGSGEVVINLHANATLDYNAREAYGTAETTSLTINGNGNTLTLNQKDSDWSSFGLANADAKVVFNNMIIEKTGYGDTSGAWNTHAIIFSSNVEMTNVTVNNSMAVQDGATLNNVTINEANGYYGLWINGNGQSVTMNGGSINAINGGRGIKIADEYVGDVKQVTLNVTGTTFNTAKKAAVLVSSTAGAKVTANGCDITDVAEDSINFVWVDEEWAAYYNNVKVYDEATKTQENEESFPIKVWYVNGEGVQSSVRAYYKNLDDLFAAPATQVPGSNYIDLRDNVVANNEVDVNYGSNRVYTFGTSVEGGVTMEFRYDENWNKLPKFDLGQNITMNVSYLQVIGGDISIAGTLNTGYLYLYGTGEGVVIEETGVVNANVSNDKTVQVKGGTVLTVNGKLNTSILNVWTQDVNNSKLIVSGADAQVTASHIHAWNGKDGVSSQEIIVESGALLTAEKLQADRGSIVTVDAATLTATTLTLGYEGNIGTLVVRNNGVITNGIVISSVESTVSGPENLTVTSGVDGYGVNYFNGVYSLVEIEIQETKLFKGWNWFSAYVDINGEEGLTKVQNVLAGNATIIKSQSSGFTSYSQNGHQWYGELQSLSIEEMYMIQMETAMTGENIMKLEGNLVNPSEHTIQLNQNWNWIGYPSNEKISLDKAFNGFTPQNGDRIKSHVGFSQYYGEGSNDFGITGWWGTLNTMTPGLGYMYYRAGEGTASFTYNVPADGAKSELRANITADDNYWVPATHRYANNMTMVAMLEGANADNYEVAAFVDGEVRGSARPVYVEPLDAYMFFLTIYGDEVEEMSFRCYDLATGEEYAINDRINYSVDSMLGSIEEPYMFRGTVGIGEATLSEINIYPNPTTTGREISFDATCETVEVFNTLGVKVAEYHYVDTIDAFETAGIYMIRITNNGNVQNCRVVVK